MSTNNKKTTFYSVARGNTTGIFTGASGWSKCNMSVHRYNHALYKSFTKINDAIEFLLAGNAYNSCKIPVFDDSDSVKSPKDYGHKCDEHPCSKDLIDPSIIDEFESLLTQTLESVENTVTNEGTIPCDTNNNNKNTTDEETFVKQADSTPEPKESQFEAPTSNPNTAKNVPAQCTHLASCK